jgi:murein L,D-transpeptidase YafK
MSVILSGVWRSQSARRTQSKDPCPIDASEISQRFLTVRRSRRSFAVLAGFLLLLATSDAQRRHISAVPKADRVLVLKHDHILRLLRDGQVVKEYKVALGGSSLGPKTQQGDHKTPEGIYVLDSRNAKSQFYKSLHISYPTPAQRTAARKRGVSPGGDVFVHGLPAHYRSVGAAHRLYDWTDGCIALTDEEIDEIWLAAADGTPIEIRP